MAPFCCTEVMHIADSLYDRSINAAVEGSCVNECTVLGGLIVSKA